ncbi:MAG: N-methyl-L-tryptophan oxidase [Chloroflexota bacterium]
MTNHQNNSHTYDLIVVGLGAMGSAALYQAAKAGINVLGIDRFAPPHNMGSSHAETRITRLAVGEGPQYLPLVARSHEIWRELEATTGHDLLYQSGLYIITPPEPDAARGETKHNHWDGFVARTAEIAAGANIPYEQRTAAQVRAHLPYVLMRDGDIAGYEPTGGVVLCEQAVEIQIAQAKKFGAEVVVNQPVTDIQWGPTDVTVTTAQGRYDAEKVIVTAGAWMPDFLPALKRELLTVTRQVVYWFEVEEPAHYSTDNFPAFLWVGDTREEYFSTFPSPPDGIPGLKVLTEQFDVATDPNTVERTVTEAEIDTFYDEFLSKKLSGVTRNCIKAEICLYTNTPDDHFLIDFHPASERVLLASPCSGHGFKHSAAVGEAMVQLVMTGQSEIDLSSFAFDPS